MTLRHDNLTVQSSSCIEASIPNRMNVDLLILNVLMFSIVVFYMSVENSQCCEAYYAQQDCSAAARQNN